MSTRRFFSGEDKSVVKRARRAVSLASGPVGPVRIPEEDAERFPYADLSPLEKEAAEDALRLAWERLPARARLRGVDLRTVGEEPITRLLRDELDQIFFLEDHLMLVFRSVSEAENVPDCTGKLFNSNHNRPDLFLRPAYRPPYVLRDTTYGIFIECKIVDKSHDHHGITDYCKAGLRRFIEGEYGWAMPSGMMVAYVRNRADVPSSLHPHLDQEPHREAYKVKELPSLPKGTNPKAPPIYYSTHARPLVRVGDRDAGDIVIAHLWLHVA